LDTYDMNIQEIHTSDYPPLLREIPQVPKKLWLRGSLPSPNHKTLAVVGSRALSAYGRQACELLIQGLAGYPISIISGLALGADACAHKAALKAGLHTVAVLGSGVHDSVVGPKTNLGLAREILNVGGALISENEPRHIAVPYDFPARNRIMVGLSQAALIIEAGEQSGTLITARMAADYNRELLCIPHRIGDPHGHGSEIFLRLGATLITESEHILEALGIEPRDESGQRPFPNLSASEAIVYNALAAPCSRDELLRTVPLSASEVLTNLMSMELKGLISERFGAWRRI
jgi:DNA processing protein